ncbi:hypothetical protein BAE44_0017559 [Dichanthelium oligosanthes]|uniref:KIB1-4 beta-propeller domain-containing protein n=1 Tax=Dichanthelium oligosanthes TaxID=888268 RepID=A0A1E5V8D3_9POAL|nr:hypothetical protein BAE44_0017559 [Dichanthelium oligosanthes]
MATSSPPAPALPCLVFDYGEQQCTTLFSVSDGVHGACDVEELRGKRSWPTSHGWVLAWDPETTAMFLWNPHDCHLGGSSIRVVEGDVWCKNTVDRLTSCRGRFSYLHTSTELGVIDFSPPAGLPAFSTVPMRMVRPRVLEGDFMASADMYILYAVSVLRRCTDISSVADVGVYRMDLARQEHVRVESVGDRAILVGSRFGGWCPAPEFGLLPSSVYWITSVDKQSHVLDIRLHVFDIELRTEEVHDLFKDVAVPHAESVCALSGRPTVAAGCTVVLVEPPQSTVLWYCHVAAGDDVSPSGGAGTSTTWAARASPSRGTTAGASASSHASRRAVAGSTTSTRRPSTA